MGKLKRHLGVTYKWEKVNGVTIMEASMPKLEDEIIMAYENLMKKIVKEQPTSGYPGKTHKTRRRPNSIERIQVTCGSTSVLHVQGST